MAFIPIPLLRRVLLRTASFEVFQALLAMPFHSPFKVVAKEVKHSSSAGINDARFGLVRFQYVFFYPVADLFQRLFYASTG
jgi:hypothetical protein